MEIGGDGPRGGSFRMGGRTAAHTGYASIETPMALVFALNQPEPPPRDSFWKSHWSYSRFAEYAREATTVGEIVNLAT